MLDADATSAPATLTGAERTKEQQDRLALVVDTVREISLQTDPQTMVSLFRKRATKIFGSDGSVSLSRRGLAPPLYRITRSAKWSEEINPWSQPERLPILKGGILGELLYRGEPLVLNELSVPADDPAHDHLCDTKSLVSLPLYDNGVSVNMVVRLSSQPRKFDGLDLANALLEANLFGRATSSLLTAQKLHRAYAQLDHEMARVVKMQQALLPSKLPAIDGVDIAVSYKTATRAGGDYYDFFDLGDGRWGILMADASGHGTPAAVMMAMLRTMLHAQCVECVSPAELLAVINKQLVDQWERFDGSFVTAFYGVLDANNRTLAYASAGHPPPLRIEKSLRVVELDQAQAMPLAVSIGAGFSETEVKLNTGDTLLLYTDGITEATSDAGEFYGKDRLLSCITEDVPNAQHIIDCITHRLLAFAADGTQADDQTLLALRLV